MFSMIRGNYLTSMDDIARVLAVRKQVFDLGEDASDAMAFYALAYSADGQPAGAGRLCLEDDHFTIDLVGVIAQHRLSGLGDLIMRMLLQRALDLNAPDIRLTAPAPLGAFFARYGFRASDSARDGATAMLATPASIDAAGGCSGHCGKA